jgi:hypothetical protein
LALFLGFRVAIHTGITDNRVRIVVASAGATIFLAVLQFKQQLFSGHLNRALTSVNQAFGTNIPVDLLGPDASADLIAAAVLISVVALA